MMRRPPRSTLLPYPTLFRSRSDGQSWVPALPPRFATGTLPAPRGVANAHTRWFAVIAPASSRRPREIRLITVRSEEHTSELQSRQYLVCRLLLEKKKHHPPQ